MAKKTKRYFTYNGKRKMITAWAEESGIPYDVLNWRIGHAGWGIDKALTTPVRKMRRKAFGSSYNVPVGVMEERVIPPKLELVASSGAGESSKKTDDVLTKIANSDTYVVADIDSDKVSDDDISVRGRYTIEDIIAILNILK